MARKVLVVLTDGYSEAGEYGTPTGYGDPATWNSEAVTKANALKAGCDGNINTPEDNIEIYTVGFYCKYSTAGDLAEDMGWCKSQAADYIDPTTEKHPCPGPSVAAIPANRYSTASQEPPGVDELLTAMSSSTAGSCDHYYPIRKGEDLPSMFRVIAGSIARGRLQ
jgi:hypothetical protein